MEENRADNMGARLKSMVQDLEERVRDLKLFDRQSEVNCFCDDLESQVILMSESIMANVAKMQESMLGEIKSYRKRLIESAVNDAQDSSCSPLKEELSELASQVEELSSKLSPHFQQPSIDENEFKNGCSQAKEITVKAKEARQKLREEAFHGDFMKFNEGMFFKLKANMVGYLGIYGQDVEDEMTIKHYVLDENQSKASVFHLTHKTRDKSSRKNRFRLGDITCLTYLSDGNLAIFAKDYTILVWSPASKKELYKLNPLGSPERSVRAVNHMAELPDGHLVSSHLENYINIWSLKKRRYSRTITTGTDNVQMLKVLPNGNLVVLCCTSILVLNHLNELQHSVLQQISMDGFFPIRLSLVSDGDLAAFDREGTVKIWNLANGMLRQQGDLPKFIKCDLVHNVLPNGDAIECIDESFYKVVRMHSLTKGKPSREFNHVRGQLVSVAELPNNTVLFVHQNEMFLKILVYEENGTRHRAFFNTLAYSPDGKYMAMGCSSGTMILWRLNE